MKTKTKNIYYLEELSDYKVASDDPDVRGWEVKDRDGKIIGEVKNLLVNKQTERVVYLDVEVDESIIAKNYKPYSKSASDGVHGFLNEDGENHIIIPIGMVNLQESNKIVSTNEIDHKTFAETKRKTKDAPVYRDYEVIILDTYTRSNPKRTYPEDESFYTQREFDQR